jgi:outer membrane protein assembly factor BamE (lipoprotein component of BamABCDE complex)
MKMRALFPRPALNFVAAALLIAGCSRGLTGSKLTLDNYKLITPGMSKGQAQEILGAPSKAETKSMVLFEKTTWRYEEGSKFVILTFKNDQLESKDGNLATP